MRVRSSDCVWSERLAPRIASAIVVAGMWAALEGRAAAAVTDFVCLWANNAAGNWSDTNPSNQVGNTYPGWGDVTGDGVADVADDTSLLDSTNIVARFSPMTSRTVTLDSNRTVSRLWYNWNGGTSTTTAGGSLTLAASGGSVLTLTRDGGTPEIHIGYRFSSGNTGIGVTINAPLAGTQGFTVGQPASSSYAGYGLILGGANTVSGTISAFTLLTLRHELAAQNARLSINGNSTLRLRHDTDGATFPTAGVTINTLSTTAGVILNVDRNSASGETGHRLVLGGPITVSGQDRIKTLSVTGANGYRLELTGCYTNTFAAATSRIDADSANVALTGPTHNLGGGLVLGGTLATGVNSVSGVVAGTGGIIKTNESAWALSGTNTYTGTTAVKLGALLVNGGSIGTTAATGDGVTVSAGGTLGGASGAIFANVALAAAATLSPGAMDAAGSLVGSLTIGDAAQSVAVTFASNAVFAVDVAAAAADLLSVKGSVALGSAVGDVVSVVVRELSAPTAGGYKVLDADGGITIPGTVSLSGSSVLTRYELRDGNTELWVFPPPPACTLIQIR